MSDPTWAPPPPGNQCAVVDAKTAMGLSPTSSYGMGSDAKYNSSFGGHYPRLIGSNPAAFGYFYDSTLSAYGPIGNCVVNLPYYPTVSATPDHPLTYCDDGKKRCDNGSRPLCYPNSSLVPPVCASCICGPQPLRYGQAYTVQLMDSGYLFVDHPLTSIFTSGNWLSYNDDTGHAGEFKFSTALPPIVSYFILKSVNPAIPTGSPVHSGDLVYLYVDEITSNSDNALNVSCISGGGGPADGVHLYTKHKDVYGGASEGDGTTLQIFNAYNHSSLDVLSQGTHLVFQNVDTTCRNLQNTCVALFTDTDNFIRMASVEPPAHGDYAIFAFLNANQGIDYIPAHNDCKDTGCNPGETCDPSGNCQGQSCRSRTDCVGPNLDCTNGYCQVRSCTSPVNCDPGYTCDLSQSRCVLAPPSPTDQFMTLLKKYGAVLIIAVAIVALYFVSRKKKLQSDFIHQVNNLVNS